MDQLPLDMCRENTCCFTGHRSIPEDKQDQLAPLLLRTVRLLAESGYRYFLCGGALGFDTMVAKVVVHLSAQYPIKLVLALPCRNQTEKWSSLEDAETHLRHYKHLMGQAVAVHYTTDIYHDGCMRERNRYMVDHASYCIAYYNGSPRSGSGQTLRMAKKAGIEICNLHELL